MKAILIADPKTSLNIFREQNSPSKKMKVSTHPENIKILSCFVFNKIASKYTKQKWKNHKEKDTSTVMMGDFNVSLANYWQVKKAKIFNREKVWTIQLSLI